MGSITLVMKQNSYLFKLISGVFKTESEAFSDCLKYVSGHEEGLRSNVKNGWIVTLPIEDKIIKKIYKQGFLFVSFEHQLNNDRYPVPLVVHSSKSGLIKKHKESFEEDATEFTLFEDCKNASMFALSLDQIPEGYMEWCNNNGLKICKDYR